MIIDENLINISLDATNKEDALNRMCEMAYKSGRLSEAEDYVKKVHLREAQVSTDMGHGIAIPHGKSSSVLNPFIIFAKLQKPIIWNEEEKSNVDIIFMIGVPEKSDSNVHLKIISQIAGKLMDDDFIENLRNCDRERKVLDYLTEISV